MGFPAAAAALLIMLVTAAPGPAATAARPFLPDRLVHHDDGRLDSTLAQVAELAHSRGSAAAIAAARAYGVGAVEHKIPAIVLARPGQLDAARLAVTGTGGTIRGTALNTISALIPPGALDAVGRSAAIVSVTRPPIATPETVDEGVSSTNASAVQAAGQDGAGVKVAVIDAGFGQLGTTFNVAGSLPGWLTTQNFNCAGYPTSPPLDFDTWGPTDHGTAVVDIVHQMAPGASVVAICINDVVDLWNAERWAATNGVRVINLSIGWYTTDSRGDGNAAGTIASGDVTPDAVVRQARQDGILWVSAVGNDAETHWGGFWSPSADDPSLLSFGGGNAEKSMVIAPGDQACVLLKWDDWPVTTEDFDLFIFDPLATGITVGGQVVPNLVAYSATDQADSPDHPSEAACYTNPDASNPRTVDIVVGRYSAIGSPRIDVWAINAVALDGPTGAGSVVEPASSPDAFAVGAVCVHDGSLEPYSSYGPTIDNRMKPDIVAPDATSSPIYGASTNCTSGFGGTSASAPHVAGAAALILQQEPTWTPPQVEAALESAAAQHGGVLPPDRLAAAGMGALWLNVPHATRIAFNSSTYGDIWEVNSDGSNAHAVWTTALNYAHPSYSPDGSKLVFARGGPPPNALEIANADGTGTVTDLLTSGSNVYDPAWSPNGTKIVYSSAGTSLRVVNADGTGDTQLTSGPNDVSPAWSPDGSKIAFTRGTSQFDIWVMNANGTNQTQLTTTGVSGTNLNVGTPSWSPDGTKIAYTGGGGISVMNADGTNQHLVVPDGPGGFSRAQQEVWSPDGTKLLYLFGNALYTANADGSGAAQLLADVSGAGESAPAWSSAAGLPATPVNSSASATTGTATVGEPLEATAGSWKITWPSSFSYAWYPCDFNGANCSSTPIAGATDRIYTPAAGDVGHTVIAKVTATSAAGSATQAATAASTLILAAAPHLDDSVAAPQPALAGTAQAGQTLTAASTGAWVNSPGIAYRWRRCDGGGGGCFDIGGATGAAYTLTSSDVGSTIRLGIVATTAGGTAYASSLPTAAVVAAPAPPPPPSSGGGGGGGGSGLAADLSVDGAVSPTTANQGDTLVWTFHVVDTNKGPAVDVYLDLTLSANLSYVSSTVTRGPGCTQSSGKVTCFLDWMSGDAASATVTVTTTAGAAGDYTVGGAVRQLIPDTNTANNTVTVKASPPPPPPPPPPPSPPAVKVAVGSPAASPSAPVAGKRFTVVFTVRPAKGAKVAILTSIAGSVVPHTLSLASGKERVTLAVPKRARGKLLKVRITATLRGATVTRTVTYRIR